MRPPSFPTAASKALAAGPGTGYETRPMNQLPSSGLRAERIPNGVRYVLPERDLGGMRWFGFLPILVGAIFLGASASWCAPLVRRLLDAEDGSPWFRLVLLLGGIPFLCIGAAVFTVGVGILFSRSATEVRLSGDVLRYSEVWGFPGKSWTRNLADVDRVSVVTG